MQFLQKKNIFQCKFILIIDIFWSDIDLIFFSYPEIIGNYDVEYSAGGAGQNTARALTWMTKSHNVARYVGCIGNDDYGKTLREAAIADGVDVHYLLNEETPTGTCAALIVEKDRSLVANLGAANKYEKSHFESEAIQKLLSDSKFLYSAGFFLTVCPETLVHIGKHAAETNKPFMFNLAAPFLIDFFTDKMKDVLPYADYVVGNETEATAFGKKFFETDDLKEVAKRLGEMDKVNKERERIVIFTQGPNPVLVYHNGAVEEFPVVALPPDSIVDCNGAGDSFCGGFLSGLVLEKDLKTCVEAGCYCAQTILQTGGVVFKGTPTFEF